MRDEMAKIFQDQMSGETLDQFLNRSVRPTPQEISSFKADIDSFVRFLHSADLPRPYSVDRVIKSGSLGKGTAVRGHADIDLVVFINGIKCIDDLIQNRPVLLQHLTNSIGSNGPWQGRIRIDSTTKFSISCTLNGNQVDILPAFQTSRHLGSPSQIYSAMEVDSKSRKGGVLSTGQEFSASLAEFQLEFVKPIPGYVKEVIRLLKLWKKENGLNIRSYSLELLTVHVWKSLGAGVTGTHKLFKAAMEMLTDFDRLRIAFNDNYNSAQYVRTLRPPYILDPANPYMNTLGGLATSGISDAARRTYQIL